ncbi:OLC1v1030520C1 [Oldenlandia corymbosa var. corymbosa]|uniref:OLC1v1030520C1 n=1 Tax=Oldenlandia corymbosa var. corymbosa TaxID=529605 RepID=A0AAV1CI54_OLDCO|nr:OLC1v1030520C1 [Oldenlandia corymbosa var. corymbosa]
MTPDDHPAYYINSFNLLRYRLQNLKMFAISTKKSSNDFSVGHFLARIEDTVRRNAEQDAVDEFLKDAASLDGELDEWYATLFNTSGQSASLTIDEVLEIIGSFQENLVEFKGSEWPFVTLRGVEYKMEPLGVQMVFLQSLIRFVRQRNTDPEDDLLVHTEPVAISAAYLLSTN